MRERGIRYVLLFSGGSRSAEFVSAWNDRDVAVSEELFRLSDSF